MAETRKKRGGAPARILIVDDHPLVREGLAGRIAAQRDLAVCGQAEDVEQALADVARLEPDLVIVDLALKGGHGLELLKRIKAKHPAVKTLVATMHDEADYGERALRAGALGYINKQEVPEKVIEAVRQVLGGKIYVSPRLADRLVHRAVGGATALEESPYARLSDRELEVFRFIGQGLTTRQIAARLDLSVKTVETHRENVKAKLNVRNSAELSRQAVQWVLENG